jgi:hypothetical protein
LPKPITYNNQIRGSIMARRKKASKVQKRAKLRRGNSAKRGKARKVDARKVKPPVTPVVETVAVEVIEQPASGVITVTEVEETEVRKAS